MVSMNKVSTIRRWLTFTLLTILSTFSTSCGVYSFKDVGLIPDNVKTVSVAYFQNKARYVSAQLSAKLTTAFIDKINSQTKLTRVEDNGDWQISGYISKYNVTTSGITGNQASQNRLTVGVHLVLFDKNTGKKTESDAEQNFDFSSSLSLPQAETQLMSDIVSNMSDQMFNKIFSNW